MIENILNLRKIVTVVVFLTGATMFAQVKEYAVNKPKTVQQNVSSKKNIGDCSDNPIYKKMIALKRKYPEGMSWTNSNRYDWKGGIYSWGSGCLGFAFILSDAAFGDSPARKHYDFNNLRIGDILRINNNTHSVVILCINSNTITLAEGNFNSSIHWGRTFSIKDLKSKINYVLTRYP